MNQRLQRPASIFLACAISAAAVFALAQIDLQEIGKIDLQQYWAAARLLLNGQNPYDAALLGEVQRAAWRSAGETIIMWNPPLVFPFIIFLGWLSFQNAAALWMLLMVAALVFSSVLARQIKITGSCRPAASRRWELLFLFTFYPFLNCVYYGQISHVLLLGLSGFLLCASVLGRALSATSLGGILLSFTLLKPHLLFLFYLFLVIDSVRKNSWLTVAGIFFGALILSIVPMLFDLRIFFQYLAHTASPPIYWQTPTLGSWLQGFSGVHDPLVRMAPSIAALVIVGTWLYQRKESELRFELVYPLIPLSLLAAPYGWVYDQMLILPTALWLLRTAAHNRDGKLSLRVCGLLLVTANLAMALVPALDSQEELIWYPLLVFILAVMRYREPAPAQS